MPKYASPTVRGSTPAFRESVISAPEEVVPATVVICVYNRPLALAVCLKSLGELLETAFEVLIVDDGSTDSTPGVIERFLHDFGREHPGRTARSVRSTSRSGVSAARNLAIDAAICFTDSDCTVPPDWLSRLLATMEDPALAAISGRVTNSPPRNVSEQVHHAVTDPGPTPPPGFLNGNNMAFRRDVLREFRFDEAIPYYCDETDLERRLHRAGHVVGFATEIVVLHHHAMTFEHLMTTARLQGIGSAIFVRKHRVLVLDVWLPMLVTLGAMLAVLDARWLLVATAGLSLHLAMLAWLGRTRWGFSWGQLLRLTLTLLAYYFCRSYGYFRQTVSATLGQ